MDLESSMDSPHSAQHFRCAICLDLVYKPVVQSCGHMFCFWCALKAMDGNRQSQCPSCRNPYAHFAHVCTLLHYALSNLFPLHYNLRAKEIQDMEQSNNLFSPRIRRRGCISKSCNESLTHILFKSPELSPKLPNCNEPINYNDPQSVTCFRDDEVESEEEEGNGLLCVEDFACGSCTNLLYRPVVLNCGEVFCESCVRKEGSHITCPKCSDRHPNRTVHVCLELHYFLDRFFPDEYSRRREQHCMLNHYTADFEGEVLEDFCKLSISSKGEDRMIKVFIHEGFGCDSCGMYPIVGERHSCLDCEDKTGYDLCGSCQIKSGVISIPGRFNQQHRIGHRMRIVPHPLAASLVEAMATPPPFSLQLNMDNGSIQRRRRQQQEVLDSMDDTFFHRFLRRLP